jgi:hypothetical protein
VVCLCFIFKICQTVESIIIIDQFSRIFIILGLGDQRQTDATEPIQVGGALEGKKCIDVSAGTTVSFAVTEKGECYRYAKCIIIIKGHPR